MPLQIRRGLDSERGSITFLDGELVYAKDTGTLWIGDGVTTGGVSLASGGGGGATNLNGLSDVTISGPSNGQVLKYNSSTGQWVNGTDSSGTSLTSLDDVPGVVLTSPTTGQVLKFNGTNWINSTDNTGTTIDSINDINDVIIGAPVAGQVLKFDGTNWINSTDNTGTTIDSINDINDVLINTPTNGQVLKFNGTNWINSTDNTGTTIDSINDINDVIIGAPVAGQYLSFNGNEWINAPLDIQNDPQPTLGGDLDLNGHVIGGTGNIFISGDLDASTITTDSITAKTGSSVSLGQSAANSQTLFRINSNDEASSVKLIRKSTNDIGSLNLQYGVIGFERNDINGQKTTGLIMAGPNYIYHASDPTGAFPEATFICQATINGNTCLGIRTYVPTEALDVRGNGKFSGFVQFGSYTSVQRDELTPAFGMVIYNTTTNTFQGYQNTGGITPEWVNLS